MSRKFISSHIVGRVSRAIELVRLARATNCSQIYETRY